MREINIVFESADTLIGKIGRLVTGYSYTHIAYSFDLNDYYSFSRRYYNNPFDSGFTIEKRAYYACKKDVKLKRYRLNIDDDTFNQIESFNETIKDLPFDIYGMIFMPFGIYRKKENAYNCMSYMARIFEIIDIPLMNNLYYRNNIKDLEDALINHDLKSDEISIKHEYDSVYMQKISIFHKIKSFIEIHIKLLKKR